MRVLRAVGWVLLSNIVTACGSGDGAADGAGASGAGAATGDVAGSGAGGGAGGSGAGGPGSGGGRAGEPYFFDDFDYAVGRTDAHASKTTAFQAAGWDQIRDMTEEFEAGGYIWTVTEAEAEALYGAIDYWPPEANRALVMAGLPSEMPYDPPFKQTDYYLGIYETIRPATVHEFGLYFPAVNYAGKAATRSNGDKWLYWSHVPEFTGGYDLLTDSRKGNEEGNPIYSSEEQNDFATGNVPNNLTYMGYRAAGSNGDVFLDYDAQGGASGTWFQNENNTPQPFGEFWWYRVIRDLTGEQGHFTIKRRRPGEAWVTIMDVQGGVTPGVTWNISEPVRSLVTGLRFPTTQNQFEPSADPEDGDHDRLVFSFGLYDSEADCPVRDDEPMARR
jgi:hypothetical protein